MLFVISPAKALDYTSPATAVSATEPELLSQAKQLIAVMNKKSPQEVAQLMSLSDKLAALNVARYAAWRAKPAADAVRPAVFAFDGDVYDGLGARTLPADSLNWMQGHVRILSGLYGSMRPLDNLQAYRLEMGTKLATERGADLYHFWGDRIAKSLNQALDAQHGDAAAQAKGATAAAKGRPEQGQPPRGAADDAQRGSVGATAAAKGRPEQGQPPRGAADDAERGSVGANSSILVNLASQEYFRAVDRKALKARVVECVFQDEKNGEYKIISFFAKRARGSMLRWAVERQIDAPDELKGFDGDGYTWVAAASKPDRLVFRRKEKA